MAKPRYITKSDLIRASQCLKNAYLHRFNPELATPTDPYTQLIMDRGNFFGDFAQKEFNPDTSKLLYEKGDSSETALEKTRLALLDSKLTTLFEASFVYDGMLVRCDILHKNLKTNKWQLYEVKSGSKLEEYYNLDVAIQHWLLTKINFPIEDSYVWHVNNKCPLPDLKALFTKVKKTEEIPTYYSQIEDLIASVKKVFGMTISPNEDIGSHCSKPFECPFKAHCFSKKKVPEFSVFNVPRIGKRAFEYYEQGIVEIKDLDSSKGFTANQARMIDCTQSGKMYLNKEGIQEEIKNWKFPLYMLDFEAMEYDLPGFPGTTPGIHVAFQASIHKMDSPTSDPVKVGEYLHKDLSDPRIRLAEFLFNHIPEEGSIVAYSKAYEEGKIKAMAVNHPDMNVNLYLHSLTKRLVDPLPIFRECVYHPDFKGSYSIKKVAPALLGPKSSYENMTVSDGTEAIMAFRKINDSNVSVEDREKLRKALLDYCDKDTEVMAYLVKWLYQNS